MAAGPQVIEKGPLIASLRVPQLAMFSEYDQNQFPQKLTISHTDLHTPLIPYLTSPWQWEAPFFGTVRGLCHGT
jgi:hypothetical protein